MVARLHLRVLRVRMAVMHTAPERLRVERLRQDRGRTVGPSAAGCCQRMQRVDVRWQCKVAGQARAGECLLAGSVMS